jgi:flagellar biogenesis protein FliO
LSESANRKRVLWAAALGGVLVLAVAFISLLAPSGDTAAAPVVRPLAAQSQELTRPEATAHPATAGSAGFSLGGGQALSLAWRLALVVVIIAVSIVGLRWWGRKTAGPRSATGFIRVVDTLAISNGRTIHLVALGDRVIAIGATAQQLTLLDELPPEDAAGILAGASRPADQPLATFASELFNSMRHGGRSSLRRPPSPPTAQIR